MEMKRLIPTIMPACCLVLLFSACSEKSSYTQLIPGDASSVVAVNLQSLTEKAGISSGTPAYESLQKAFSSGKDNPLKDLLASPDKSGIDFSKDIYIFTNSTSMNIGVVARLSNASDWTATLTEMNDGEKNPISQGDGFSYQLSDKSILAYTEDALLICSNERRTPEDSLIAMAGRLIHQTEAQSITGKEAFKSMESEKGDIRFMAAPNALQSAFKTSGYSRMLPYPYTSPLTALPASCVTVGNVSFEKGKIVVDAKPLGLDEESRAFLEAAVKPYGKIEGKFDKLFPSSTLMYFSANVNGSELTSFYRQQLKSADNNQLMEALARSVNGEVTFGLLNFSLTSMPAFVIYGEMKSPDALDALYQKKDSLGLKRTQKLVKLADHEYMIENAARLFRNMSLFYGYKDGRFYATNDEMVYKTIGKESSPSLKGSSYLDNRKGTSLYSLINVDAALQLPIAKMAATTPAGAFLQMVGKISYISAGSNGDNGHVEIVLTDSKENSLKQLTDLMVQLSKL